MLAYILNKLDDQPIDFLDAGLITFEYEVDNTIRFSDDIGVENHHSSYTLTPWEFS